MREANASRGGKSERDAGREEGAGRERDVAIEVVGGHAFPWQPGLAKTTIPKITAASMGPQETSPVATL